MKQLFIFFFCLLSFFAEAQISLNELLLMRSAENPALVTRFLTERKYTLINSGKDDEGFTVYYHSRQDKVETIKYSYKTVLDDDSKELINVFSIELITYDNALFDQILLEAVYIGFSEMKEYSKQNSKYFMKNEYEYNMNYSGILFEEEVTSASSLYTIKIN